LEGGFGGEDPLSFTAYVHSSDSHRNETNNSSIDVGGIGIEASGGGVAVGGFNEAHGGYNFCALAALHILGEVLL
jgi:hypothetical protein